ncbi:methyltransferase domain-containing protein [Nonomuraea phyllanthi]|uniref:Methyltransferase domain-containing protein n=1 Tax=Nonomuraea phyllanthi TaxID=2219224 RepID=A0A5C4W7V7_9ACTN|nr:class I SAM-dependent methyltransferase [Nonomuraea phyllanthi]KAB8192124.1 methyltransferase domain-containing protein [Nonomuraea phyllanthi]QFY11545.1 methyltransferase domain-containing protein [Nonomuraea phyllanthi]
MDYRDVNRANWNARVPIHVASDFYDVEGFKAGQSPLRAFEREEVGDVSGRRLLHLQCHFGLDTLSWARLGAEVTGLDFSEAAIEQARAIAADCGIPARFVTADVYDAAEALGGATYEIVYTGLGALVWLPDLTRWAETVAGLLEPGGFLYLAEFHPFAAILDEETGTTVAHDYFDRGPHVWEYPYTYTGSEILEHQTSVQFQHGLGEVINAVVAAGLRVDSVHEHGHTLYRQFPSLTGNRGDYRFPEGAPRIPLMYSLRASAS